MQTHEVELVALSWSTSLLSRASWLPSAMEIHSNVDKRWKHPTASTTHRPSNRSASSSLRIFQTWSSGSCFLLNCPQDAKSVSWNGLNDYTLFLEIIKILTQGPHKYFPPVLGMKLQSKDKEGKTQIPTVWHWAVWCRNWCWATGFAQIIENKILLKINYYNPITQCCVEHSVKKLLCLVVDFQSGSVTAEPNAP